jgi:hypothetical protein
MAAVIVACSDSTSPGTTGNPLQGLFKSSTGSSDTAVVQTGGDQPTPGYFHGTVRGASAPGATDTMNTAPRVANVQVTVYQHVTTSTGDTLGVGPQVAEVTTDANGEFQTPVLSGGFYIVVFAPPAGSIYHGVYVGAMAHSHSADYSWFIVLPKQ